MIPGMPGGKQFAEGLSSRAFASNAFTLAAYSGVSDRWGGAGKPDLADELRELAGPPMGISHTPVKSGNFAKAAQSAGVGAGRLKAWAVANGTNANEVNAATMSRIHFGA
jgi:hypothetical protein